MRDRAELEKDQHYLHRCTTRSAAVSSTGLLTMQAEYRIAASVAAAAVVVYFPALQYCYKTV